MRVAFVGKGGAGKSVIAGTFARLLARRGERVLAVDSDPMPGLSISLGLGVVDAPIPDDAVEERPEGERGPRYRLRPGLSATEAVERYAQVAPDGVRLLQFGKLRGHAGPLARSQSAFRQILDELPDEPWSLVGDLPGGTRQPFFGWGRYARTVLIVAEPTAKSLLSARRLARLALAPAGPDRILAVANKVQDPADVDLVRRRTGLEVAAAAPWDDAVADAERLGRALLDHAPLSHALQVLESMVDRFDGELHG
jgi:CO dehydrogenase maturation factor